MSHYFLYNKIDEPVAYIEANGFGEFFDEQPYTRFGGQAHYISSWDFEDGKKIITKRRFHGCFIVNCDTTANWWFYGEEENVNCCLPGATSHYTILGEDGLIDHMRIMAFVWRVAQHFFIEHGTARHSYSLEKEEEIMELLLSGYSIKTKLE